MTGKELRSKKPETGVEEEQRVVKNLVPGDLTGEKTKETTGEDLRQRNLLYLNCSG